MNNIKLIVKSKERDFDIDIPGKWSNFKINQKIRNDRGELCMIKYKYRTDSGKIHRYKTAEKIRSKYLMEDYVPGQVIPQVQINQLDEHGYIVDNTKELIKEISEASYKLNFINDTDDISNPFEGVETMKDSGKRDKRKRSDTKKQYGGDRLFNREEKRLMIDRAGIETIDYMMNKKKLVKISKLDKLEKRMIDKIKELEIKHQNALKQKGGDTTKLKELLKVVKNGKDVVKNMPEMNSKLNTINNLCNEMSARREMDKEVLEDYKTQIINSKERITELEKELKDITDQNKTPIDGGDRKDISGSANKSIQGSDVIKINKHNSSDVVRSNNLHEKDTTRSNEIVEINKLSNIIDTRNSPDIVGSTRTNYVNGGSQQYQSTLSGQEYIKEPINEPEKISPISLKASFNNMKLPLQVLETPILSRELIRKYEPGILPSMVTKDLNNGTSKGDDSKNEDGGSDNDSRSSDDSGSKSDDSRSSDDSGSKSDDESDDESDDSETISSLIMKKNPMSSLIRLESPQLARSPMLKNISNIKDNIKQERDSINTIKRNAYKLVKNTEMFKRLLKEKKIFEMRYNKCRKRCSEIVCKLKKEGSKKDRVKEILMDELENMYNSVLKQNNNLLIELSSVEQTEKIIQQRKDLQDKIEEVNKGKTILENIKRRESYT
jgi:hypothetical protein